MRAFNSKIQGRDKAWPAPKAELTRYSVSP
jgi:hypothetical protein